MKVYELSSRGAWFRFLLREFRTPYCSEYFGDVPIGLYKRDVQCQDVQNLILPDAAFDLVTSTEVFEHVPDDLKGFAEIFRVLRSGGYFVFTVPLFGEKATKERIRVHDDGTIEHLLPPEYHGDRLRGAGKVLAFRNYGYDIVDRLMNTGFIAEIHNVTSPQHGIVEEPVIVASKR